VSGDVAAVRVAAVFDRVDGSGRPWFSPNRWRVPDPDLRRALLGYLTGAPLVLRAQGYEPDPLDPDRRPAVPVGYRSDGTWVWQDAAGYYLDRYGIAPPEALLEHIQRQGYRPPAELTDEVAAAAEAAALTGTPDEAQPTDCRYFAWVRDSAPVGHPPNVLRRCRDAGGNPVDEALDAALRWSWTNLFARNARSGEYDLRPISEAEASALIDRRWRALTTPVGG
jgi:hypothetical protein